MSNKEMSKKAIASDMEHVKVTQNKLMKENRSLKKRVDMMQSQMREIYDILVEEKAGAPILIYPHSSRNPISQGLGDQQDYTEREHQLQITTNLDPSRQANSLSSRKPDSVEEQWVDSTEFYRSNYHDNIQNNQIEEVISEQLETNKSPNSDNNAITSSFSPVKPDDLALLQEKIETTKDSFLNKIKTVFQKHSEQNQIFERNNQKIKQISQQLLQHKHPDRHRGNSPEKNGEQLDKRVQNGIEKNNDLNEQEQSKETESSLSSSSSFASSELPQILLEDSTPSSIIQQHPIPQDGRTFQKLNGLNIPLKLDNVNNHAEFNIIQENSTSQAEEDRYYQNQDNILNQSPLPVFDDFDRDYQNDNPNYRDELISARNNNLSKRQQVEKLVEYQDDKNQYQQNNIIVQRGFTQNESGSFGCQIDSRETQRRDKDIGQRRGNEYRSIKDQYQSLLASNTPNISTNNYINSNSTSSFQNPDQGLGYSDGSGRHYDHLHQFQVPKHYPNQTGGSANFGRNNSSRATTNYTNLCIGGSNNPSGLFTSSNVSKNEIVNKIGTNSSRQYDGVRQTKLFDLDLGGHSAQISPLRSTLTAGGIGRRDGDSSGSQSLHFAPLQKKEGSMTSRTYEQKFDQISKVNSILTPLAQSSQQMQPSAQGDKITDEYIRQIIQQYKTPKKSSIPQNQPQTVAAGLQNTQKKITTNSQMPATTSNQYVSEKRESSTSKAISTSQQPSRLQSSRLFEKDSSQQYNPFIAQQPQSSRTSHSPSRFTKIQIPQIAQSITTQQQSGIGTNSNLQGSNQYPLGSLINSKDFNSYNSYFGNNNISTPSSHTNNFGQIQSSNLSTAIINSGYNQNNNVNINSNLISNAGTSNFIQSNNYNNIQQTSNNSPLSRKIGPNSPPISNVTNQGTRDHLNLNHKRQSSCGGVNGINKYNLKLNLTSLITPKTQILLQSDRQQSDRTAYSRLLPKAAMIVSTNISPKYSPHSTQSSLAQRFPKK